MGGHLWGGETKFENSHEWMVGGHRAVFHKKLQDKDVARGKDPRNTTVTSPLLKTRSPSIYH